MNHHDHGEEITLSYTHIKMEQSRFWKTAYQPRFPHIQLDRALQLDVSAHCYIKGSLGPIYLSNNMLDTQLTYTIRELWPVPSVSMSWPFGASPMSIVNITILGVMVDILLLKQNLYVPSMCAATEYFPLDSRSPLQICFPSGPVICRQDRYVFFQ